MKTISKNDQSDTRNNPSWASADDDLAYHLIRKDDPQELQNIMVPEVRVKVFKLWNSGDLKELEEIKSFIQKERCLFEEKWQYVEAQQNFLLYIQWTEFKKELSPKAKRLFQNGPLSTK